MSTERLLQSAGLLRTLATYSGVKIVSARLRLLAMCPMAPYIYRAVWP